MSWRTVVISKPSKLDYNIGYLVVRNTEQTVKVHLSEISLIIVENTACSVSCSLLSKLVAGKIKVIFCDEKRNPSSELTPFYGSHDCSLRLKQQIAWSEFAKQRMWTEIVAQKIKKQANVLRTLELQEYSILECYLDELEFFDKSNREGTAAKVYFNALFGKHFSRSDDNPINAALNYGYSLLLSCFNREVVCSGYLTQLGLFHSNMYNQYNLSCDLMEPFRPIVDLTVKYLNPEKFETNEKREILPLLNVDVEIDGKTNTMINAIQIYSKSVFNAIDAADVSLINFPVFDYEL